MRRHFVKICTLTPNSPRSRGKVTTYEYESSGGAHIKGRGQVTKVTYLIYPSEKHRTFVYDRYGRVTHQENELGQPMEYDYDDYGRVTQTRTPHPSAGNPSVQDGWDTVVTEYDPDTDILGSAYERTANAPTVVISPSVRTSMVYDENLRLQSSTQVDSTHPANSATTQYHYDPAGNRDSITDPNNNQTTFEYDQRNRRKKATSPPTDVEGVTGKVALVTEWFYDPVGNVRLVIQPDLRQQSATYDALDRVLTSKDPMDRVTTYEYWPSGTVKSIKDPNNHLTQFRYDDPRDLKTKLIYPDTIEVTGWEYDENGNPTKRPTVGGPKQLFTYDDRNRLQAMRWDNAIDFSDFVYDDAGRLNYARNPYSTVTRQYDIAGRMILDQQELAGAQNAAVPAVPPSSVVSRRNHGGTYYDIALPLSGTPGVECRDGGSSHDYTIVLAFPAPVSVGGAVVSSGIGNVVSTMVVGNEVMINLTGVSNAQRMTVKVYGLNNGTTTGEVTVPMHVLIGDVNGNGTVTATDRTIVQAQLGVNAPVSGSNFRCDLIANGQIDSMDLKVVKASSGTFVPDAPLPGPQVQVKYEYDLDGRANHLYVEGTGYDFKYGYDALGRLERIRFGTDPETITTYQYVYDKASNVRERWNYLNHGTAQFSVPDELNRVKERTIQAKRHVNGQMEDYVFSREHYGFDAMSRLKSTMRDEEPGKRDAFGYNDAGELTRVDYGQQWNGTTMNPVRWVTYNLDAAGNRAGADGVNDTGSPTMFTPNPLNQYSQTNNGNQHEIIGYADVSYRYLADTFLAEVSAGNQNYKLGYDALGRCVRRETNGQVSYFAYDGARAILDYNADGAITVTTLYGLGMDEIIARNNHGDGQFLHQDRLGSTSAVTNFDGEVVEQYRYDAFGQPELHGPPTTANPQGAPLGQTAINNRVLFTGREWVQAYGFYEYRARAYHPKLGRFMSEDPMGFAAGDTNLFRYCGGDPVNWIDPSGLDGLNDPPRKQNEWRVPGSIQGFSILGGWTSFDGLPFDPSGSAPSIGGGAGSWVDNGVTIHRNGPNGEIIVQGFPSIWVPYFGASDGLGTFGFGPGQVVTRPPATQITFAFGPGIGGYVSFTWDKYGHKYISLGGQVGKSWPVSASMTGVDLFGNSNPTEAELAGAIKGFGYNATMGVYYVGGQLAGPANAWIFNPLSPLLGRSGGEAPNSWGVGFVTPQAGVGLGWTWQVSSFGSPNGH